MGIGNQAADEVDQEIGNASINSLILRVDFQSILIYHPSIIPKRKIEGEMAKSDSTIFGIVRAPQIVQGGLSTGVGLEKAGIKAMMNFLLNNSSIFLGIGMIRVALLFSGGTSLPTESPMPDSTETLTPDNKETQTANHIIMSEDNSVEQRKPAQHEISLEISFLGITIKIANVSLTEDIFSIIGLCVFVVLAPRLYKEALRVHRHSISEKAYQEAEKTINVMIEDLIQMIEKSANNDMIFLISTKDQGLLARNLMLEKAWQIKVAIEEFQKKYNNLIAPKLFLEVNNLYSAVVQSPGQRSVLSQALHNLRIAALELKLNETGKDVGTMIKEIER